MVVVNDHLIIIKVPTWQYHVNFSHAKECSLFTWFPDDLDVMLALQSIFYQ
jgi:hypothetical protein